jgi:tol-pal system protein YbgF
MNRTTAILILSGVAFIAGCASRQDMTTLQRDLDETKGRLVRMEKDLGGVKAETRTEVQRQLEDVKTEITAVRKLGADIQASLDVAKVDSQVLSGKLDDLALQSRKPSDDLALMKEDTQQRLSALDSRIAKLEKGFEEIRVQAAEAKAKAETPSTPEALYQKALETYRAGDMTKARELFTAFLEKNPNHDLAANAHYWLGESFYGEKRFEQAVLAFHDVIKKFPGKEKVPAAMLKQGMAFREMGDVKSARFVFNRLIDEHPKTEEAAKAREKLKELK